MGYTMMVNSGRRRRMPPRYKSGPKKGRFMTKAAAAASRRLRKAARRGKKGNPNFKVRKGKKRVSIRVSPKRVRAAIKASGRKRKVTLVGRSKAGKRYRFRVAKSKLRKKGLSFATGKRKRKHKKTTPKRGRSKSRTTSKRKKSRSSRSRHMAKSKRGRGHKKAKASRKSSKRSRAARKAARTRARNKAKRKAAAKKAARSRKRRHGGRRGKRRASRRVRVRVRRRGRGVSISARPASKRRRVRVHRVKRKGRKGSTTLVIRANRGRRRRHNGRRRGRRHNSFLNGIMPSFVTRYTRRIEAGFGYVPGVVIGVASANILPRFAPAGWNTGVKAVLLSLAATAVGASLASMWSEKQALGAAIGGVFTSVVKAVALFTDPSSKIRDLVGVGLSDLGNYAGLGDPGMGDLVGDEDVLGANDDISSLDDDRNAFQPAELGMSDMADQVELGLSDQVVLDSF